MARGRDHFFPKRTLCHCSFFPTNNRRYWPRLSEMQFLCCPNCGSLHNCSRCGNPVLEDRPGINAESGATCQHQAPSHTASFRSRSNCSSASKSSSLSPVVMLGPVACRPDSFIRFAAERDVSQLTRAREHRHDPVRTSTPLLTPKCTVQVSDH